VHQPFRLKRYRFFDIGSDNYYYDDFANEDIITGIARRSYLKANAMFMDLIRQYGDRIRIAFSLSGVAIDQMEMYAPEVVDSFRELAGTGCAEFLAETYNHSLASLEDQDEFRSQVKRHSDRMMALFDRKPEVFRNTELIYSDEIGELVSGMGYKAMLVEGAKHVLGWKSPNYVYSALGDGGLKLLVRNMKFSDDISFRFSNYNWREYPLVAEKLINWIVSSPESEQIVNIWMNYDVLGSIQPAETGIFEFFKAIPRFAFDAGLSFSTPSDTVSNMESAGELSVRYASSWAGEEKDISHWCGNVLQKEAMKKLYGVGERVRMVSDRRILQDWDYLQSSDHFNFMSTKLFPSSSVYSPYENAFDAFSNYMNVLSDFTGRVKAQFPDGIENEELNALLSTIMNQEKEIKMLKKKLSMV
jgi:alpha-amylase